MITLEQAYNIAIKYCMGIKLDKIAYDLGDSFAFDYGGDEDINGFLPVIVKKEDGQILGFNLPDDFDRMWLAKRVKVFDKSK